jgi:hypothetical protein
MVFPFIGKTEAQDFRLQLYNSFKKRNDLTFELIDALSSQTNPSSGIGLSLSSLFTRKNSSVSQLVSQVLGKEKLEVIINNHSSALYKNFILGDPQSSRMVFQPPMKRLYLNRIQIQWKIVVMYMVKLKV